MSFSERKHDLLCTQPVCSIPTKSQAAVRASLALTMLLMLKSSMCQAYKLSADRVAAYGAGGDARKQEERAVLTRAEDVPLPLHKLDLEAHSSVDAARKQYTVIGVFVGKIHACT